MYKKQGTPDRCPISSLILFTCATPQTKSKGLPIDVLFHLILFTRTTLCTKSKGLPIDVLFHLILFIRAVL
jgi:hypothetical protein